MPEQLRSEGLSVNQIAADFGHWLVEIRPWLTTAGVIAGLGFIVQMYRTRRTSDTADQALVVATDKDVRDAYAAAVGRFADEAGRLRQAMLDQDENHERANKQREEYWSNCLGDAERRIEKAEQRAKICDDERGELRDKLRAQDDEFREKTDALRDLVNGLIRSLTANAASQAVELGDIMTPEAKKAAKRVDEIFERRNET